MSSISIAQYREMFPQPKQPKGKSKGNKFKAMKVELDGITLKTKIEGEKRAKPALRYFADFTYYRITGEFVVEDVKSVATRKLASYRNKKHLMKTVHGIDVREV